MRLTLTPLGDRTPAQAAVASSILNGPRAKLAGPLIVLLEHPTLCQSVQALGETLRFAGVLPARLRELATLVTAAAWHAEYEWHAHVPIALAAGLDAGAIAAIRRGDPPQLSGTDLNVYELCRSLLDRQDVSDERCVPLISAYGNAGVLEIVALCGYYSLIAMVLDVAGIDPAAPVTP